MKKDEDALIWVGGRNIRAGGLRESSKADSLESTPIEGDFSPEAPY